MRLNQCADGSEDWGAEDIRSVHAIMNAGADVREPFRLIGVRLQFNTGDERFVAADNDHDQQIGDHDDIDQPEHDQDQI